MIKKGPLAQHQIPEQQHEPLRKVVHLSDLQRTRRAKHDRAVQERLVRLAHLRRLPIRYSQAKGRPVASSIIRQSTTTTTALLDFERLLRSAL